MQDGPNDARIEGYLAEVQALIAEHGWAVQAVTAEDSETAVAFQYTVGLTAYGHPEIIVYGLAPEVGGPILNALGGRVRRGDRLAPGDRPSEVIGGSYEPELVAVDETDDLIVARAVFGELSALQLVLPDPEHRMPWDEGFRMQVPLRGRRAGKR